MTETKIPISDVVASQTSTSNASSSFWFAGDAIQQQSITPPLSDPFTGNHANATNQAVNRNSESLKATSAHLNNYKHGVFTNLKNFQAVDDSGGSNIASSLNYSGFTRQNVPIPLSTNNTVTPLSEVPPSSPPDPISGMYSTPQSMEQIITEVNQPEAAAPYSDLGFLLQSHSNVLGESSDGFVAANNMDNIGWSGQTSQAAMKRVSELQNISNGDIKDMSSLSSSSQIMAANISSLKSELPPPGAIQAAYEQMQQQLKLLQSGKGSVEAYEDAVKKYQQLVQQFKTAMRKYFQKTQDNKPNPQEIGKQNQTPQSQGAPQSGGGSGDSGSGSGDSGGGDDSSPKMPSGTPNSNFQTPTMPDIKDPKTPGGGGVGGEHAAGLSDIAAAQTGANGMNTTPASVQAPAAQAGQAPAGTPTSSGSMGSSGGAQRPQNKDAKRNFMEGEHEDFTGDAVDANDYRVADSTSNPDSDIPPEILKHIITIKDQP